MTAAERAALLLLADSQLLFRPASLPMVREHFGQRVVRAAYVGASNEHQPEFYQLACAALESLLGRVIPCTFIRSPADIDESLPDLLILAGGNVSLGWAFLQQPAVATWLARIQQNPAALVIGVSAGAIQLARGCDPDRDNPVAQSFLDWFPHFVAVHEEQQQWPSRKVWQAGGQQGDFVALPFGGGLWIKGNHYQSVGVGPQLSR